MTNKHTIDDIYSALVRYLDTYFIERDLEKTLKLFSTKITGFGTGIDEKAYNLDDFQELFSRDISQAQSTIHYAINKLHIESPQKGVGVVTCELNIKTTILEQELLINNLRLSLLFIKSSKNWLIEHMHISLPTVEHEEQEAYPIKELENRNEVLKRLVDEKTKILKEANQRLEKALNEVKTLRGIIPICSHCKSIRSDDQSWHLIETYIREHSDAEFSHGICPDCVKKIYPDLDINEEK